MFDRFSNAYKKLKDKLMLISANIKFKKSSFLALLSLLKVFKDIY